MKRKLFAKKDQKESSLSVPLARPVQTNTSSWKLYQSCQKCPLDVFLDCLYDDMLEGLIIEGDPPVNEIQNAWNKLHAEYSGLMMSGKHSKEMELVQEVNTINAKLVLIDGIIQHLIISYDKELVDILNALLLKCDLLEDDPLNIAHKKLKGVAIRAKKLVAQLQLKENELKKIQESSKGETGREYYSKTLLILSKENGYAMRENDITVYQFIIAVNMLNDKITEANAAAKRK